MNAALPGTCATCGLAINVRDAIAYNRKERRAVHAACSSVNLEPAAPRESKPTGRDKAEAALADVLAMFESGELPNAIAQTVIARSENSGPSAFWSLSNQLLMLMAGTADSRGYRQWQEVGRHVKKGARAFYILAPSTRRIREEDPDTGETGERVVTVGFVGVPVFRIEDTEGDDVRIPDYEPPEYPPLFAVAERLGLDVAYVPFVDRVRGWYSPGRHEIRLCSHDESVFFHELAHAAHDIVAKRRGEALKVGQVASQEIVAETVAATLSRLYCLDGYVYHGAEYIRHYAKGANPARAAMRVLAEVQAVLELILEAEETATEHERELVAA